MRKTIFLLFLFFTGFGLVRAEKYPANPNIADRHHYVADEAGVLEAADIDRINDMLWNLRNSTSVEMGVAILPNLGREEIQPYSVGLFQDWGLGKSDKDNGVLLVVDMGGKKAFITTGYGVEGVLTDMLCRQIITEKLVPFMREGRPAEGIENAVSTTVGILENPRNAEELMSQEDDIYNQGPKALDKTTFYNFILIVVLVITASGIVMFIGDLRKSRKEDVYHRAKLWRSKKVVYWILVFFSAGLLLPFAIIAESLYHRNRNRRIKCPTCGHKMNKLSEEQDNELLSSSQDLEEKLGSVDYDVWVCPECGTIERFPFREKQTTYTECPACHTVAMQLVSDRVIRPATIHHGGEGVKTYKCLFCHHTEERRYKIPKKNNDGALLAAGAILGASSRGGGGFGGGIGGGFGGGSTGGGGGGAGW